VTTWKDRRVIEKLRIEPGSTVELARRDASATHGAPGDRAATEAAEPDLSARLLEFQSRLWAEARRSVLVVLQGLDAAGKDGTIRYVFRGLNPQAVRVAGFKEPTAEELSHDFLWRVHKRTPAAGEIGIFNRSHYEDVLVVRVHEMVPEDVWRARYDHINAFEALLAHGGTTTVKFFLHLSRDEQGRRLLERLDQPEKRWKTRRSDFVERERWTEYQQAYTDMLERTSTTAAPWYIVPADHKWYRNWAVSNILVHVLEQMDPHYPEPPPLGEFLQR